MVSIQHVVLWLVVYTIISVAVSKKYGSEDDYWSTWGPLLTLRSKYGLDFIRSLANKGRKAWRPWGVIGVISAVITGFVALTMISLSAYGTLSRPDAVGIEGPTDLLVIPGVNRFIPLSAAPELIVALIIAMVIHEGGHAIYCVLGDIEIKSTGAIFGALIPIGAFVEPEEEDQNNAKISDQMKMYSAGIMNNYAVFVITIVLLFILVPVLVSPVPGVAVGSVLTDSPAEQMGLESGDVITTVNGEDVQQPRDIQRISGDDGIDQVGTSDGETYEGYDGVYISQASNASNIDVGRTVVEVDGTPVSSNQEYQQSVNNRNGSTIQVTYNSGDTENVFIGLYITAQDASSSLADSLGIGAGESTLLLSVNGESVTSEAEFTSAINTSEEVELEYYTGSERVTETYSNDDANLSSVIFSDTPSSIQTTELGINVFPKDQYHSFLSFGDTVGQSLSNLYSAMVLPILSIIPGIEFGLPGFTPFIQNFYTITVGSAGIVSTAVFFSLSVLFWTAWININLAIFNCLPTFALDGGHMVKAAVWGIPFDIGERYERYIILGIKTAALIPLLALLFAPLLL